MKLYISQEYNFWYKRQFQWFLYLEVDIFHRCKLLCELVIILLELSRGIQKGMALIFMGERFEKISFSLFTIVHIESILMAEHGINDWLLPNLLHELPGRIGSGINNCTVLPSPLLSSLCKANTQRQDTCVVTDLFWWQLIM